MQNPKSLIIKLSAAFLGALLFLTFFSNTVMTLNLPGVVVSWPSDGVVTTTFRSFADVQFAETQTLFAEDAGRISIYVAEGDVVEYNDILFTIQADSHDLLERLEDEQSRLDAALINLTRTRSDLSFEQGRLAQLTPDTPHQATIHAPDTTRFEHEARRLAIEIERAEADYHTNTILHTAGAITQTQLNDSYHILNQLRESYLRNAQEMEVLLEQHARNLADADEAHVHAQQQRILAFETEHSGLLHRIDTLGHTIRLLETEEADRRRAMRRLQDQIADDGTETVHAAADGIISEIGQGLEDGMMVNSNQIIMRYAHTYDRQYIVHAEFPERIGTLHPGSNVRINIPAIHQRGIAGEVLRTTASGGRLRLEIAFATDVRLNGGERAEIVLQQASNTSPNEFMRLARGGSDDSAEQALPNSAIREDFNGHYIMFVEREENAMLGYSYYARMARIRIVHEGDRFTLFESIGDIDGPVIISSDRPFRLDSRVRIVDDES